MAYLNSDDFLGRCWHNQKWHKTKVKGMKEAIGMILLW